MMTLRYTLLLLFCAAVSIAQPKLKQKMEQVKSLKVAFITNELELTPEESAKFWPIYNRYEDRQRELRKRPGRGNAAALTEKEAAAQLDRLEQNEQELYQSRRDLIQNLKDVLPATKIVKLKKAEDDFSRKLLRQYRQKRKR